MDVIEMTRKLGEAIQADDRYIKLMEAKKANDADFELNALIGKLNLIQMSYQHAQESGETDENKLNEYDKEFRDVYGEVMLNPHMKVYEEARQDVDDLMNYIVQILSLCVNGEDPATCSPQTDEGCTGSCSTCGGCG
ncbi:MAG: YlbF family regulator [Clostridiales bacterium]|nr:YlbF family regulator [Clostridiales bacterium]